jgi:hypothetical protein
MRLAMLLGQRACHAVTPIGHDKPVTPRFRPMLNCSGWCAEAQLRVTGRTRCRTRVIGHESAVLA